MFTKRKKPIGFLKGLEGEFDKFCETISRHLKALFPAKLFCSLPGEQGYALASILLLITILSLVGSSILLLQYHAKQLALIDVAKVKTEYAAESGIAEVLSRCRFLEEISDMTSRSSNHYAFKDGSEAQVEVRPWGSFLLVRSEGSFHKIKTIRFALVADLPSVPFNNALVFGNPNHQLIFASTSSITGNVVVGHPGVTIGNLRGRVSPTRIPIHGDIKKETTSKVPVPGFLQLTAEINAYQGLLSKGAEGAGGLPRGLTFSSTEAIHIRSGAIPDSLDYLFVQGDVSIEGNVSRRYPPLYIVVDGTITLQKDSQLRGVIALIASKEIEIKQGAWTDQAILFSRKSVELQEQASVSAQLIASLIRLNEGSVARYPSVLLSLAPDSSLTAKQEILIKNQASVEGFVGCMSAGNTGHDKRLVILEPAATITGAVYSNHNITLDGTVIGTVITNDFYFYEAPTTYLGWLRSGNIDRTKLPSGFLVPPGFSHEIKLDVLEWL